MKDGSCFGFAELLVLRYDGTPPDVAKVPDNVWRTFQDLLRPGSNVTLCHGLIHSPIYDRKIDHSWVEVKTGKWVKCLHWERGERVLVREPLPTDEVIRRYTPREAVIELVIKAGHWGPVYPPQEHRPCTSSSGLGGAEPPFESSPSTDGKTCGVPTPTPAQGTESWRT